MSSKEISPPARSHRRSKSRSDSRTRHHSRTNSALAAVSRAAADATEERLALMRPSRELLEYYRRKVAQLDADHEALMRKLDGYAETCEEQHKLQWELRQREDEIAELQRALSDMQTYLFQEREHVLRLYSENDRLKIRELEDRKKMNHLLQLTGASQDEVTYFIRQPPALGAVIAHAVPGGPALDAASSVPRMSRSAAAATTDSGNGGFTGGKVSALKHEAVVREAEALRLQVQSLQAQLEEQAKVSREQTAALLEDRRIHQEECETARDRDQDKVRVLTEKVKRCQELLYDSTQDLLAQRREFRDAEREWVSEKDRLLQELDVRVRWRGPGGTGAERSCATTAADWHRTVESAVSEETKQQLRRMEEQLAQQTKLADMYREQVISMEDDLSQAREESDVSREVFKERAAKMSVRLQSLQRRYDALERRRQLEVEGFHNDIRALRSKLRQVERQLYKVTLGMGDALERQGAEDINPVDMAILKSVRISAGRTKQLADELKQLKSMIYGLENDLRQV